MNLQDIIRELLGFWEKQGFAVLQPLDMPVGAGTFHPATALRALRPERWQVAYVQPSRRPTDGRYGRHRGRLQRYYQLQVVRKPADHVGDVDQFIKSLEHIGIRRGDNDIRFVEDNWESPTLDACGLGWEIWCNGLEITQFTYFQQMGGIRCRPDLVEITYGVERLGLITQGCGNVYDLKWNDHLLYRDLHHMDEIEQSHYNFDGEDDEMLAATLEDRLESCMAALTHQPQLIMPAYERVLEGSHIFNVLDARGHYTPSSRTAAIAKIRKCARYVISEACSR